MSATATHDENGIRGGSKIDELLAFLTDDERHQLERDLKRLSPRRKGAALPPRWRERIPIVFPRATSAPFANRHEEFWDWCDAIELDSAPRPFCGFWPRGGGKSSSVELGVADLGCNDKRKYVLYVRATQEKADDSVSNIAIRLESEEIAKYYPDHSKRKTGKFGNSRGWRRNRVWTHGGFVVDALGLDVAARGVKLEDQRPDMIVFDDIDALTDGPAQTAKKVDTITKSIIPAGSNNCAILFVQNLIIRDGVASQLADGRADFLSRRIVSGPFPAVEGLKYERRVDKETGTLRAVITGGKATWAGQDLETCQRNIDQWGLSAFLKEAQHEVKGRGAGVCLKFTPNHFVDIDEDALVDLVQRSKAFAGIDPQWWRFGFTLWISTSKGVVIRVAELFSQQEFLWQRAKKIHELCESVGIEDPSPKTVPIWADSAVPTDINELNLAFKTGWPELDENDEPTGEIITSKLRVIKVANENKIRKTAVQRINNLLDKNALRFVRTVGADTKWMLGQNASSEGTEITGSRLIWEIENWAVPTPKPGEPQDENPDDDTADGADMIASMRYALMSHLKPAKPPVDAGTVENDRAERFDHTGGEFKKYPHVADLFNQRPRRLPSGRVIRPRVR